MLSSEPLPPEKLSGCLYVYVAPHADTASLLTLSPTSTPLAQVPGAEGAFDNLPPNVPTLTLTPVGPLPSRGSERDEFELGAEDCGLGLRGINHLPHPLGPHQERALPA
jgi:hypothetical protein